MGGLIYEKDGHIATITFNRPEAKNSLDPQSIVDLIESLEDFDRDENLRVAVVTGAGDQAFCSGADLGLLIPVLSGARKPESDRTQYTGMKPFRTSMPSTTAPAPDPRTRKALVAPKLPLPCCRRSNPFSKRPAK